jgi:hypothetical protein
MPSSRMLRLVALIRTDVSEERIASMIRVTGIGLLGTALAVTSIEARCVWKFALTRNNAHSRKFYKLFVIILIIIIIIITVTIILF